MKNWVTLNEPYTFIYNGYVQGTYPPGRGGKNQDGDLQVEPYIVAYNLLNSHAAAYRKYQQDYKVLLKENIYFAYNYFLYHIVFNDLLTSYSLFQSSQKGKVGITLNCEYFQPYRGSSHQQDIQAVDYAYDFVFGW